MPSVAGPGCVGVARADGQGGVRASHAQGAGGHAQPLTQRGACAETLRGTLRE